jgi:galactokinase
MDLATLEATPDALPGALYRRARHVITENARVCAMADALRAGDRITIGRLIRDSHESLRTDFEVSAPELDTLVAIASGTAGVIGARMTGAGFGGCTVNLVESDSVSAFEQSVLPEYGRQTGLDAEIHLCRAWNGLRVTDV